MSTFKPFYTFGLIGCGNIGTEIAHYIDSLEDCHLTHVMDDDPIAEDRLIGVIQSSTPVKSIMSDMLLYCDVIIEAASKDAVKTLLIALEKNQTDNSFIILSTGGLTENIHLFDTLNRGRLFIPAGAIGGLDALAAVKSELTALHLKTTKPAGSLSADNESMKEITLYEGGLGGAIQQFPKNINVAATLFLHTRFEDLKVEIISSPTASCNRHEIEAIGTFGRMYFSFENETSRNPKTSMLTLYSVKSVIDQLVNQLNYSMI
jgi:aspartate dehydrogenase